MLKLTKTGIGLLTKQYRSVLRKCLLLNYFILSEIILNNELSFAKENTCESYGGVYTAGYYGVGVDCYFKERPIGVNATFKCTQLGCGYYISWWNLPEDYGPYNKGDEEYGFSITHIEKLYSGKYSNFSSVDEALEQLVFGYSALSNSLYNYYYTKDEVQAQLGVINLTSLIDDTSYKNTASLGGNYIKPYIDVTLDSSGEKPTWAVSFSVKLTDGNSYAIGTWSGGTLPYRNITEIDNWQPVDANDPNTKYYFGALSGVGSISHPVTQADRDIIVAKAQDLLKDGKLWKLVDYGVKNVSRNDVSVIDNIGILDDVIGTWNNGTHIKEFDYLQTNTANQSSSVVMAYGTIGANLKALDTAIGSWSGGHYIKNSVSSSTPADTTHLTVGQALSALDDALYNYYYTFRVDERTEATEFTSFFQKDFSTLQEVNLHIKNPTHLGAFTKCDEVCPRPSERFSSSLSQEQMFKNNASVDAGTFSICSLQIENVNEKLSNVFDV